jgi:hypothetical protein
MALRSTSGGDRHPVDDRVREQSVDGPCGESLGLGEGYSGELETIDASGTDLLDLGNPEKGERFLDARGLGVDNPGLELDANFDARGEFRLGHVRRRSIRTRTHG